MYKKLYRSTDNRVLAGVFGGLGEYFNVDPVVLRLLGIVLILCTGIVPGLIAYLLAIFVVPEAGAPKMHDQ